MTMYTKLGIALVSGLLLAGCSNGGGGEKATEAAVRADTAAPPPAHDMSAMGDSAAGGDSAGGMAGMDHGAMGGQMQGMDHSQMTAGASPGGAMPGRDGSGLAHVRHLACSRPIRPSAASCSARRRLEPLPVASSGRSSPLMRAWQRTENTCSCGSPTALSS